MEMCPYCGEDVPANTAKCWKCGTELSERTPGAEPEAPEGADGISLRGPAAEREEEAKKKKKKQPMRQCPFCETLVPLHSLRCNRCGQKLKEAPREVGWQKSVWIAFAVVAVAVGAWLLYGYASSRVVARVDKGRDQPIKVTYSNLARIFLTSRGSGLDQREASWRQEHEGKYIEWSGIVTRVVDADEGIIEAAESATATFDEPEVRLSFKDPDLVAERGLKQGKLIKYSARLVSYLPEEGLFVLDNALLIQ